MKVEVFYYGIFRSCLCLCNLCLRMSLMLVCLPEGGNGLYVLPIFLHLVTFQFFYSLDNSFTNSDGQRSRTSEVIGKSDE